MRMRLLLKLSAVDGLVNESQCTVVKVVPHESEELPTAYREVKLKYPATALCNSECLAMNSTDPTAA